MPSGGGLAVPVAPGGGWGAAVPPGGGWGTAGAGGGPVGTWTPPRHRALPRARHQARHRDAGVTAAPAAVRLGGVPAAAGSTWHERTRAAWRRWATFQAT